MDGFELSVRDSGPGVADKHLPRLFDSFFTTKHVGIGMGLAICRSIFESHEGGLTIENMMGGGAIARVIIPTIIFTQAV
jgi:signal transduction histidine kinase